MTHYFPEQKLAQSDQSDEEFLDGSSMLQGKLEGCTVNSQGVTLNHTTYYLNPDAHSFACGFKLLIISSVNSSKYGSHTPKGFSRL